MKLFARYFPADYINARVRNVAGDYMDGDGNFSPAEVLFPLTESAASSELGDSLYTAELPEPAAYPVLVEYVAADNEIIGTERIDAPLVAADLAAVIGQDIDDRLSLAHGAGAWGGAGTVAIPSMTVSFSASMIDKKRLTLKQGDSGVRVSWNLGADYTSWTPRFAAKKDYKSSAYAIAPKVGTWSDAATGQGYVDLDSVDLGASGEYIAEVQLSNGSSRLTPLEIQLSVLPQIITY